MTTPAPDLHPRLEPLGFLVGTWEGIGALIYPTIEDRNYLQIVTFSHDGRPFLHYSSRTWLLNDDGTTDRPGGAEEGFWRPGPEKFDVEVLIAHPTGVLEMLVGTVAFKKIELVSDAVVRTATAKEVTATTRLYGGVDDDLAYVVEMAAVGQPLQPHLSARLSPVNRPEE